MTDLIASASGVKRVLPTSFRAALALVLLLPSLAGCLGAADATLGPQRNLRPLIASGCTQADVIEHPLPYDAGPAPWIVELPLSLPCGYTPTSNVLRSRSEPPSWFMEWTPDGKRLMLNAPKEGHTYGTGIYLVSPDGSDSRLLVDANNGLEMDEGLHADLSPDGSTLVYSTCIPAPPNYRFRGYELAHLSIDEGTPEVLTNSGYSPVNYPVWSPDGSRIAFIFDPMFADIWPTARLYTMEVDGGTPRVLTPHLNWRFSAVKVPPTWSPDGERIAYLQDGTANYDELFTIEENGFGLRGVTRATTGASWAPVGRRFAFGKVVPRDSYKDSTRSTLCIAELDDLGRPRLSQVLPIDALQSATRILHVNWSPDGAEILFMVEDPDLEESAYSVYLIRPDGTGLRRLLEDERPYSLAAWSPDSSQIAIRVDPVREQDWYGQENPPFEVLIVARDGTVQKVLGREEVLGTR